MNQRRTGVLFIHGIQGGPQQFDWIIDRLPAHVQVENLLLPGHGGDVSDFRRSGMRKWQACVDEAIGRMSKDCDFIVAVTHSMGGLLAMDACIGRETGVKAMVLLACPLKLRPTLRYFRNACKAFLGKDLDDPYVAAAKAANSVRGKHLLSYLGCAGPYLQLLFKIPRVRRRMAALDMPLLAIHSAHDEIVSEKSLKYFKKLPGGRTCIVHKSGHLHYSDGAKDLILRSILAFTGKG